MADLSAWHYSLDALPSVEVAEDGQLGLRVIIGTHGAASLSVNVNWSIRASTREWGEGDTSPAETIPGPCLEPFTPARPAKRGERVCRTYTIPGWFSSGQNRYQNQYWEALIPVSRTGTEVRYEITVTAADANTKKKKLGPYRIVVARPSFVRGHAAGGRTDPTTWIGFVQREEVDGGSLTHIRLDLDDISAGGGSPLFPPVNVRFRLDDRWIDVDPGRVAKLECKDGPQLPLIDWAADRIELTVSGRPQRIAVEVAGRTVELTAGAWLGCTRLLLEHFAIQGFNDLLERPFAGSPDKPGVYRPPRTYMQVTMRDDQALYSSKPGSPPGKHPDGYSYGFDAHRRFDVPYEIAFNAGLLTLLSHDCRPKAGWHENSVNALREDISAGLLHPTVAGFGSHRVPYYAQETNKRDIQRCIEVERSVLKACQPVFYPDQRIYKRRPNDSQMFVDTGIEYIVFDADSAYARNIETVQPNDNARGLDLSANQLWQDRGTGLYLLLIDDQLKDAIAAEGDYDHPTPSLELRRRLMRFALDPRREKNLLVYGDDFEKCCGNGWFEGGTTAASFFAFLEWISADRLWLDVVTSEDLKPGSDCVGTIDVPSATDPMIGYVAAAVGSQVQEQLQFDYWEQVWRDYPAAWTGDTLGVSTYAVEHALLRWPKKHRNELFEIAWLAFLSGQHENAWNKVPEGSGSGLKAVLVPEDFTVVEGLQIRNVLVWLKASVWATWARENPSDSATYVNEGPVHKNIDDLEGPVEWSTAGGSATHWDGDPLETWTLYNSRALVVLDRNGGRVTHAFVTSKGRPRAVSGTFKCYQYTSGDGRNCDGPVLQNTVWTPNHRYIGSDLGIAPAPQVVVYDDIRSLGPVGQDSSHELLLPDNFNAYEAEKTGNDGVTMRYATGAVPDGLLTRAAFEARLHSDGKARRQRVTAGLECWHPERPFSKTFKLEGTQLKVEYQSAPVDKLVVDNEFCVDLFRGVMGQQMLTRQPSASRILIRSKSDAVAISDLSGCQFTDTSLMSSVKDAGNDRERAAFMELHRVLTDAVQVRPTLPTFSYLVDLNANPGAV